MKHGTITGYIDHGCRCDDCRTAKTDYYRMWRKRKGIPTRGNPVTDGARVWPSEAAAGRDLGISGGSVRYHLNRYGDLSHVGKPRVGRNGGLKTPVRIAGREWPSKSELARHLGKPISTVWKMIDRNDGEAIVAALMAADAQQQRAA